MESCLKKTCWGEDKENIQKDAIAIELHHELPYILKSEVRTLHGEFKFRSVYMSGSDCIYTFFRER